MKFNCILRPRFSLRTILLSFVVVAALLYVAINYLRPKMEHRFAVGRILNSGAAIWFVDQAEEMGVQNPYTSSTFTGLWRDVGMIDIKSDAQAILLAQELTRIPEAHSVSFEAGVTDKGLFACCNPGLVASIEHISFYQASITKSGLSKLASLPKLQVIMFNTTPITPDGLAELKAIPQLRQLMFLEEPPGANCGRLSDQSLAEIGQLGNLQELKFGAINISDSGARHLHGLKQLKRLSFFKGHVSDGAVSELHSMLPMTEINCY